MIAQYIELGNRGWSILVYYNADYHDSFELEDSLKQIEASQKEIDKALDVLNDYNTGFTFSNEEKKMSIVCISKAENEQQFLDTAVHEIKHVQSHICEYYDIDEDSEEAAYLIGYIARRMYRVIKMFM